MRLEAVEQVEPLSRLMAAVLRSTNQMLWTDGWMCVPLNRRHVKVIESARVRVCVLVTMGERRTAGGDSGEAASRERVVVASGDRIRMSCCVVSW